MNIPEDISAALSRRTRLAIELNNADYVVSKFIDTNKAGACGFAGRGINFD